MRLAILSAIVTFLMLSTVRADDYLYVEDTGTWVCEEYRKDKGQPSRLYECEHVMTGKYMSRLFPVDEQMILVVGENTK